jgi:hypothetical protein
VEQNQNKKNKNTIMKKITKRKEEYLRGLENLNQAIMKK